MALCACVRECVCGCGVRRVQQCASCGGVHPRVCGLERQCILRGNVSFGRSEVCCARGSQVPVWRMACAVCSCACALIIIRSKRCAFPRLSVSPTKRSTQSACAVCVWVYSAVVLLRCRVVASLRPCIMPAVALLVGRILAGCGYFPLQGAGVGSPNPCVGWVYVSAGRGTRRRRWTRSGHLVARRAPTA